MWRGGRRGGRLGGVTHGLESEVRMNRPRTRNDGQQHIAAAGVACRLCRGPGLGKAHEALFLSAPKTLRNQEKSHLKIQTANYGLPAMFVRRVLLEYGHHVDVC